jgi:hypothetical protein
VAPGGAEEAGGAEKAKGTGGSRRALVTERDVGRYAHDGKALSDGDAYLVTPAARDRAKVLGIWRESR